MVACIDTLFGCKPELASIYEGKWAFTGMNPHLQQGLNVISPQGVARLVRESPFQIKVRAVCSCLCPGVCDVSLQVPDTDCHSKLIPGEEQEYNRSAVCIA